MGYQDWKVSWTVKIQDKAGIDVDTVLNFKGSENSWTINTTDSSCSWNNVPCTYNVTSDTVTGTKGNLGFTIVRSVVAPPGKDFIRCEIPQGGVSSEAFTSQGQSKAASARSAQKWDPAVPEPGGTWTAEEGSGVY